MISPASTTTRQLARLRGLYALHYAGAGLSIPYLSPFLESAGVSGSAQGVLFAVRNVVFIVTQPMLGMLADRIGIARVLKGSALIAAVTWLLVLRGGGRVELAAIFLLMAVGVSAVAGLIDANVLATLESPGGLAAGGPRAFARTRVGGSIGFALAALVFGFVMSKGAPGTARTALVVVAFLQLGCALLAMTSPPDVRGSLRPPNLADAGRILRNPTVGRVVLAGALHWVTLAPYHTFFGAHVEHHGGGPMTIGLSIGVAVGVELAVFATAPRWLASLDPRKVLVVSTGVGVVRWSLTAIGSPPVIVAAQALHGLSYGAFYLSMIDSVVRRTAPEHRATAQALVSSLALGVGTFAGNLLAGPLYDVDQGTTLFLAAAGFSLVSAAVASRT